MRFRWVAASSTILSAIALAGCGGSRHYVGFPEEVYEPGVLATDYFVPDDERGREALLPHVLAFLQRN